MATSKYIGQRMSGQIDDRMRNFPQNYHRKKYSYRSGLSGNQKYTNMRRHSSGIPAKVLVRHKSIIPVNVQKLKFEYINSIVSYHME